MRRIIISLMLLLPIAVMADQLGPDTTQSEGPSRDTSSLLQPASPTTAQSLQGADATEGGLPTASPSTDLQGAGNSGDLKTFAATDQSSSPQVLSTPNSGWPWLPIIVIALAGAGLVTQEYLSRRNST